MLVALHTLLLLDLAVLEEDLLACFERKELPNVVSVDLQVTSWIERLQSECNLNLAIVFEHVTLTHLWKRRLGLRHFDRRCLARVRLYVAVSHSVVYELVWRAAVLQHVLIV